MAHERGHAAGRKHGHALKQNWDLDSDSRTESVLLHMRTLQIERPSIHLSILVLYPRRMYLI